MAAEFSEHYHRDSLEKGKEKNLGIYNYSEELFAVPQGNGKDLQTISL